MSGQIELTAQVRHLFETGTVEVRDALRAVANTVLGQKVALMYEGEAPDVEQTYRLLDQIQFSGDGTQLLPADEIHSLDSLLNKKWQKVFFSAVSNMALTMYCTDPRTAGKGYWPKYNSECCELLNRAFIWVIAQHGLENLLIKDTSVVSHTRLPQFIIALQTEGQDAGVARHFSLYNPHADTGSISSSNLWSEEYKEQRLAERTASRPPEYDQVRHMSFDELATLCERLKLIALRGQEIPCLCDDEDCECDPDEQMTRGDFDTDGDDLRELFYEKYGDPDDDVEMDDESTWHTGKTLMEVEIDLPTVRLPPPPAVASNSRMKMPSRAKKATAKNAVRQVVLTDKQQVWHELEIDHEFGDRRFAITLVSRHTSGVSRAVATNREALAVAYTLVNINK